MTSINNNPYDLNFQFGNSNSNGMSRQQQVKYLIGAELQKVFESMEGFKEICGDLYEDLNIRQVYGNGTYNYYEVSSKYDESVRTTVMVKANAVNTTLLAEEDEKENRADAVKDFINNKLKGKSFESADEFKEFCGDFYDDLSIRQVYGNSTYNYFEVTSKHDESVHVGITFSATSKAKDTDPYNLILQSEAYKTNGMSRQQQVKYLIGAELQKVFESMEGFKEICGDLYEDLNIRQVYGNGTYNYYEVSSKYDESVRTTVMVKANAVNTTLQAEEDEKENRADAVKDFVNNKLKGKSFESADEFKTFCGEFFDDLSIRQVYGNSTYNYFEVTSKHDESVHVGITFCATNKTKDTSQKSDVDEVEQATEIFDAEGTNDTQITNDNDKAEVNISYKNITDLSIIEKNPEIVVDYLKEAFPKLFENEILDDESVKTITSNSFSFVEQNNDRTDIDELTLFKNAVKVQVKLTTMSQLLGLNSEKVINDNFASEMETACNNNNGETQSSRATRRAGGTVSIPGTNSTNNTNTIPDNLKQYVIDTFGENASIVYDAKNSEEGMTIYEVKGAEDNLALLFFMDNEYSLSYQKEYLYTAIDFDVNGNELKRSTNFSITNDKLINEYNQGNIKFEDITGLRAEAFLDFFGNTTTVVEAIEAGAVSFHTICSLFSDKVGEIKDILNKSFTDLGFNDLKDLLNTGDNSIERILSIAYSGNSRISKNAAENNRFVWNANGVLYDEKTKQGGTGNCWFLAANVASSDFKIYIDTLKEECFTIDNNNQTYTVKVQGKEYKYTFEQLKNAKELSNGDYDVRALEMAAREYFNAQGGENPIMNGGWLSSFTEFLTGKDLSNCYSSTESSEEIFSHILSEEYIATISSLAKGIKLYDAETGEEVDFVRQHAYALVTADDNYLYIKNPWDSSRMLKLDRKSFTENEFRYQDVKVFDLIDGIKIANYDIIHTEHFDFKPDKLIYKNEGNTIKYTDGSYDYIDNNKFIRYDRDGNITESTNYEADGSWVMYSASANTTKTTYYNSEGQRIKDECYDKNGNPVYSYERTSDGSIRIDYNDSKNYIKIYNKGGNTVKTERYEDGRISRIAEYSDDGSSIYTDYYYSDGNLAKKVINDGKTITSQYFDKDGKMFQQDIEWEENDKKHKLSQYFDENGNLVKEEKFINNRPDLPPRTANPPRPTEPEESGNDDSNEEPPYEPEDTPSVVPPATDNNPPPGSGAPSDDNPDGNDGNNVDQSSDGKADNDGNGQGDIDSAPVGTVIASGDVDCSSMLNGTTTVTGNGEVVTGSITNNLTAEERQSIIEGLIKAKTDELAKEHAGEDVDIDVYFDTDGHLHWSVTTADANNATASVLSDLDKRIEDALNDPNYLLASTEGGGNDDVLGFLIGLKSDVCDGKYLDENGVFNYVEYYKAMAEKGLIDNFSVTQNTDENGHSYLVCSFYVDGKWISHGKDVSVKKDNNISENISPIDKSRDDGYGVNEIYRNALAEQLEKLTEYEQAAELAEAIRNGFIPKELLENLDENVSDCLNGLIELIGSDGKFSADPDKNFNGFSLLCGGRDLENYANSLVRMGLYKDTQQARDAISDYLGLRGGIGIVIDAQGFFEMLTDLTSKDLLGIDGLRTRTQMLVSEAKYAQKTGNKAQFDSLMKVINENVGIINRYDMIQTLNEQISDLFGIATCVWYGSENVSYHFDTEYSQAAAANAIFNYAYEKMEEDEAMGYNNFQMMLRMQDRITALSHLKDQIENSRTMSEVQDYLDIFNNGEENRNTYSWLNTSNDFWDLGGNTPEPQERRYSQIQTVSYVDSLRWTIENIRDDIYRNPSKYYYRPFGGQIQYYPEYERAQKQIEELYQQIAQIEDQMQNLQLKYYEAVLYYGSDSEQAQKAKSSYERTMKEYYSTDSYSATQCETFYYA